MSEKTPQVGNQRRFIAGAVCPQCRALDRLVISRVDEHTQRRECVSCGFSDETKADSMGGVPRGKVERLNSPDDVSVQNVRMIDPEEGI